jgi:hypothetical protein
VRSFIRCSNARASAFSVASSRLHHLVELQAERRGGGLALLASARTEQPADHGSNRESSERQENGDSDAHASFSPWNIA